MLAEINNLCLAHRAKIEVRFFGHYQSEFDAQILAQIPDVVHLSVDSLRKIRNVKQISCLKKVCYLSFGVFEFDQPEILEMLPLDRLKQFSILENRKPNIDLALLTNCKQLDTLYVEGHTKNLEAISSLPGLSKVTLRAIPKSKKIEFLSACEKLVDLTLIFGGRQNLADFSHPNLESLSVIWVKGLEDLGPINRFPKLKNLVVEDQLRLHMIDVSATEITNLRICNCKNLDQVKGLSDLKNLKVFWIYKTKLPLEELMEFGWPISLEELGLYSQSQSWNKKFDERSAARGYSNRLQSYFA